MVNYRSGVTPGTSGCPEHLWVQPWELPSLAGLAWVSLGPPDVISPTPWAPVLA